jgi:hypothetical protein
MRKVHHNILEEPKNKKLSRVSSRVYQAVLSRWPINPLEVAEALGDEGNPKSLSAKYLYHLKTLNKKKLIVIKKLGNTYVAWPNEIEKLRLIHELIKGV